MIVLSKQFCVVFFLIEYARHGDSCLNNPRTRDPEEDKSPLPLKRLYLFVYLSICIETKLCCVSVPDLEVAIENRLVSNMW